MTYNIVTISDSGKGISAINEAKRVLSAVGEKFGKDFHFDVCEISGTVNAQSAISEEIIDKAKRAHAILFDITNARTYKNILNELANALGLYAEVRRAKLYPYIKGASTLKEEFISDGIDILTVCDVPNKANSADGGYKNNPAFGREAYEVAHYSELEIERVARIAYELSETRRRHITLADNADTGVCAKLWRKIVTDINEDYPYVQVDMTYADEVAAQLVCNPSQFDVILTTNAYGFIMSKLIHTLVGATQSIRTALLGETTLGAYGTIPFSNGEHSFSAYQLTEKNTNPIDIILSAAFMLRHSFDMQEEADSIENAVERTVADGYSHDIGKTASISSITDAVISKL